MKVEGFGNKYTIYFAVYLKKIYQLKNRNNKMTFYNIFIYYFILISYIYYFLPQLSNSQNWFYEFIETLCMFCMILIIAPNY
jgi:hypothetical protein